MKIKNLYVVDDVMVESSLKETKKEYYRIK